MDVIGIFDKMNKASEVKQKFFDIRDLKETIERTKNECGSCSMWMTQQCPREARGHKVSCGEAKCEKFSITGWTTDFIERKEAEIKELSKPCI